VRFLLKKNQLALILLTLVMMLTIYYIKSPFSKPTDEDDGDKTTTGRLEELTEMRLAVREERAQVVLGLDAIIADSTATLEQKTAAIDEKRYINFLNEKELLLELQVINAGYQDCFVHATSQGVEVLVVADEHSIAEANEILIMAMQNFNFQFDNIYVNFQTVEQVSGTAG
jgi:hypothetical protein